MLAIVNAIAGLPVTVPELLRFWPSRRCGQDWANRRDEGDGVQRAMLIMVHLAAFAVTV